MAPPPSFAAAVAAAIYKERATNTPTPPQGFKSISFAGKATTWIDFNHYLSSALEMPAFSPGGTASITMDANQTASRQLRLLILQTLTGDAASHFDERPDLIYKGFEMVTILRDAHALSGNLSIMAYFCKLTDFEMGPTGKRPATHDGRRRCSIFVAPLTNRSKKSSFYWLPTGKRPAPHDSQRRWHSFFSQTRPRPIPSPTLLAGREH